MGACGRPLDGPHRSRVPVRTSCGCGLCARGTNGPDGNACIYPGTASSLKLCVYSEHGIDVVLVYRSIGISGSLKVKLTTSPIAILPPGVDEWFYPTDYGTPGGRCAKDVLCVCPQSPAMDAALPTGAPPRPAPRCTRYRATTATRTRKTAAPAAQHRQDVRLSMRPIPA